MRQNIRLIVLFLISGSVMFCGARTNLQWTSNVVDSSLVVDGFTDTQDALVIDQGQTPDCMWTVSPPQVVVERSFDVSHGRAVVVSDGILVPWTTSNDPLPDPNWYIQKLDLRGTAQGDSLPFTRRGTGNNGLFLGVSDDRTRVVAVANDNQQAVYSALSVDGRSQFPPRSISMLRNIPVRVTNNEFYALEQDRIPFTVERLVRYDFNGNPQGAQTLIADPLTVWDQAVYPTSDGYITAWMPGGLRAVSLKIARRDFQGQLLGSEQMLATFSLVAKTPRVLQTNDQRVILVWQEAVDQQDTRRVVKFMIFDQSLQLLQGPMSLPDPRPGPGRNELVFTSLQNTLFLAWINTEQSPRWVLTLQPYNSQMVPLQPPIAVPGEGGLGIALLQTPSAGVFLFRGSRSSARTALFSTIVQCTE